MTVVGLQQSADHADCGRLAAAVGAEERVGRAAWNDEVEAVDRDRVPVLLAEAADLDRGGAHRCPVAGRRAQEGKTGALEVVELSPRMLGPPGTRGTPGSCAPSPH